MTHLPVSPEATIDYSGFLIDAQQLLTHPFSSIPSGIICGDSLDLLQHFPTNSIDLIHTSPPYNIEKPYADGSTDNASYGQYLDFLQAAISEMTRILRPGGSLFWQTGYTRYQEPLKEIVPIDHVSHRFFSDNPHRCMLWDRIIWRYWGGHAFTKKFTNKHETIMWYVKRGAPPQFDVDTIREKAKSYDKRNNLWGRNPGNVWEVDRVAFGTADQTSHIAVFPEEISERIVRACYNPNDLVLDPFSGSGTVPKVAHGLGRRWIGIEIAPTYAIESIRRIAQQQPCETDTIASGMIASWCIQTPSREANLSSLASALCAWLERLDLPKLRKRFDKEVIAATATSSRQSAVKVDLWKRYDALLTNIHVQESDLVVADRLLCHHYKLRKHLNGITRYRTLLETLERLAQSLAEVSPEDYVRRIVLQEPATYQLSDSQVIKVAANAGYKSRRNAALDEDDRAVTPSDRHQGRLL